MNDDKYLRSVKDLEEVGCKWWPKEVRDEAMRVSILQYLLDTQEKFISLVLSSPEQHNIEGSVCQAEARKKSRLKHLPYHIIM